MSLESAAAEEKESAAAALKKAPPAVKKEVGAKPKKEVPAKPKAPSAAAPRPAVAAPVEFDRSAPRKIVPKKDVVLKSLAMQAAGASEMEPTFRLGGDGATRRSGAGVLEEFACDFHDKGNLLAMSRGIAKPTGS